MWAQRLRYLSRICPDRAAEFDAWAAACELRDRRQRRIAEETAAMFVDGLRQERERRPSIDRAAARAMRDGLDRADRRKACNATEDTEDTEKGGRRNVDEAV
ncbi:MAG: hypothetical protein ACE5EX_02735 [Phycisphaerae bacterium]